MASVNTEILDAITGRALDLQRLTAGQLKDSARFLKALEGDIVAQLAKIDPTGIGAPSRQAARLEKLLAQVNETIRLAYRGESVRLVGELRELADIETTFAASSINKAIGAELITTSVTRGQLVAIVDGVLIQGAPVSDWLSRQAGDTLQRFTDTMRLGIAEGETNASLIRRIRGGTQNGELVQGFMDVSRRNAESLVRSATQAVSQKSRQSLYEANQDLVKALQWVSTIDLKTTIECFPASTLALPVGNLREVFSRSYDGDMLVITTASGKQLRCTPNHPVLTARGWRPANEIEPSKDVLHRVLTNTVGVLPDEDVAMPATIGAIADAAFKISGGNVSACGSTEADFHGDGQGGDKEIHRTGSHSDLGSRLITSGGKDVKEALLIGVHMATCLPASSGLEPSIIANRFGGQSAQLDVVPLDNAVKAASGNGKFNDDVAGLNSINKRLDDQSLISAHLTLPSLEGRHDASALEDAGDGRSGDAISNGDLASGGSIRVVPDNVVSVVSEFFSGHVFNLQTSHGYYIADSFIVHNCSTRDGLTYTVDGHEPIDHSLPWGGGPGNLHWGCRSTSVPVLKSFREIGIYLDEVPASTRASMDGQIAEDTTFEGWLSRQSKERQDANLGPGRADLWRDGKINFRDLVDGNGRELTLAELRERV